MDEQDAIKLLQANPPKPGTNDAASLLSSPGTFPISSLNPVHPRDTGLGPPAMVAPSIAGRSSPQKAEQDFRDANQAAGVPLDTETGASQWERFMLGFRRERSNQVAYLQKKYGPNTVREASDGSLIVRVPDPETGSSKDLLVDEHKLTLKDFTDLAGTVPEIAASILAVAKGRKIPGLGLIKDAAGKEAVRQGVIGAARDIGAAAAGAETVGGVKDVGMNVYDRRVLDIPEVAKDRAKMAGLDVAVGGISYPVARFFQWLKNPAHNYRGQVQFDALAAQKYFRDKYGIDVPLSVGESTGMPLAARSEVFVEKMPGGSEPIRQLKAQQESAFRNLQEILMGNPGTDEEVGQRAIAAIRNKIEPVVTGAETANQTLANNAQSAIEGIVSGTTLPSRELYKSSLGADVRAAVIAKRDAVKAEADRLYGQVRALPGGEGKIFDGSELQEAFKKIRKSLPAPEQTVENPVGLIDLSGNEIKQTSRNITPLREFVPANTLPRLDSVINLKDAKFSLSDLQQMRREVFDDLAKGEGVPGLGPHYLSKIGDALTSAIEKGVDSLPNSDLKTALQAANKHYRENVVPFNRQGLTELFRTADEVGHVSDSEVISRVLGGEKATRNWQLMKETLGPASPEFNRMRRSVADNLLEASRLPGEQTIDAKSLMQNLSQFRLKYPEIADQVFLGNENQLFKEARFLGYAQGDKINANDLQKLLRTPGATAKDFKALVMAERDRDAEFRNSIVKAIGSGSLDEQTLKPTEFVNRLLQTSEPTEVNKILDLVGRETKTSTGQAVVPPLLQDLRQKTFEKLFRDAARNASAEDVNRIMSGENTHILSGVRIADALKNPTYNSKVKAILGPELFDDLTQYIKLQTAPEKSAQSFAAAGGLAAGAQIAGLERRGLFAYMSDSVRNFVFATILSRPPLRNWLTSVPNEPGKWSLIFSSPPFLEAVTKEFGHGSGADAFMTNLQSAIARSMTATPASQRTKRPTVTAPISEREAFWKSQLDKLGTNRPTPTTATNLPAAQAP